VVLQLGTPDPTPVELAPSVKYLLEACPKIDVLSTTNPFVESGLFSGTGAPWTNVVGKFSGQIVAMVTLTDMTQPALRVAHTVPNS
jgi:hypothetical protein